MISRDKRPWTQERLDAKLDMIRKRPQMRYSFEGAILCNLRISDIVFDEVNFIGTNMAGCELTNVHFTSNCRFSNTCLVGARFTNTKSDRKAGLILTKKENK